MGDEQYAEIQRLRAIEQRIREALDDPFTLPGQARTYRRFLGEKS